MLNPFNPFRLRGFSFGICPVCGRSCFTVSGAIEIHHGGRPDEPTRFCAGSGKLPKPIAQSGA